MKLIYILGCGRSGTTLSSLVLGNHAQVQSVGEIYHLHRQGWNGNGDAHCACGMPTDACNFWQEVYAIWIAMAGADAVQRYLRYQQRFEDYRSFYRLGFLWTIRERYFRSAAFTEYVDMTVQLYRAVSKVSGKPHLIDSSKNPLRAYALMLGVKDNPSIELYVLHLIRDGRGVIFSKRNSRLRKAHRGITVPRFYYFRASAYWACKNLLCELLTWIHGSERSMRVRYESLAGQPARTLDRIARLVGIDYADLQSIIEKQLPIENDHTVAGNRLRMNSDIVIRPDTTWRSRMPDRVLNSFWRLWGWSARRYGYDK